MNNQDNNFNFDKSSTEKNKFLLLVIAFIVICAIVLIFIFKTESGKKSLSNDQLNQTDNEDSKDDIDLDAQDDVIEYVPDTDIVKRSLGQTANFDNGVKVTLTKSIEYKDNYSVYAKPMYIKTIINNSTDKYMYQDAIGYGYYANMIAGDNPIEFKRDDYNYTHFVMEPIYALNGEAESDHAGCVIRQNTSQEVTYLIVEPGQKVTAYIMCYFRESSLGEELDKAEMKAIYLYNDTNKFMYFLQ